MSKNNTPINEVDSTMIERLKALLSEHVGKENPITSAQVASFLKIEEDDTHAKTRALIRECVQKYDLPLAAGNRGYYIITSQNEYNEYIANLDSRIAGIEERKGIVTKNFNRKK